MCGGDASLAPASGGPNGWMTEGDVMSLLLWNDVMIAVVLLLCGCWLWSKMKAKLVAAAMGNGGHSFDEGKKLLGNDE